MTFLATKMSPLQWGQMIPVGALSVSSPIRKGERRLLPSPRAEGAAGALRLVPLGPAPACAWENGPKSKCDHPCGSW